MRRLLPFLLTFLFPLASTKADQMDVRLLTMLEPLPGGLTPVKGAYDTGTPHPQVLIPNTIPHRVLPLRVMTAQTGVGATVVQFPKQGIYLDALGEVFTGALGRLCSVLSYDALSGSPNFEIEAFEVHLNEPVPDVGEYGCVTLNGQIRTVVKINRKQNFRFQAFSTVPFPNLDPSQSPYPLAMEFYDALAEDCQFLVQALAVKIQVCGEGTKTRQGRLEYTMKQKGSSWDWEYRGAWNVRILDNGHLGEGHTAHLVHEVLGNQFNGTLIAVLPGNVGQIMNQPVERVPDPRMVAAYEANPDSAPEPEALEFLINFQNPSPDLAQKMTLRFKEPLPVTGKINQLEVNHPAVLALGHWFRNSGNPAFQVTAPVTGDGAPEDFSAQIPPNAPLSLEIQWTLQ